MPSILLVRHAQASFGAVDYDVLSERGHQQAAALAEELAGRGVRLARVVTGSLRRQHDTAAAVAAALGASIDVDARWDEYDTDEILEHHSATDVRPDRKPGSTAPMVTSRQFQDLLEVGLQDWIAADDVSEAPETWRAFAARVRAALDELAAGLASGETALVCTSGGVLAATCVALLDLPPSSFVAFNRVAVNSGVTKLVHGRSGTTLLTFNEHGHLERDGHSLVTYR